MSHAIKFIDAKESPDLQANLPLYIDYGPGNPAAFKTGRISATRAGELPSAPQNVAKQALMSEEWWASNADINAKARWLKFMQQ
jgi:putative spermidine/putrescine transport system substrate-binding protein